MVSAVASVVLLIPSVPHVDDMCGVEEAAGADSARRCFIELHELLQLQLRSDKAVPARGAIGGALQAVVLGGLVDFSTSLRQRQAGLVCKVDAPITKVCKYRERIELMLRQREMTAAWAGKTVGQWDHLSAIAVGRSGRAFTWPLREHSRNESGQAWSTSIQAALEGFLLFLDASGPMEIHVPGAVSRPAALLFVDAARVGDDCRLGGVAWGPGWCHWCSTLIPQGSSALIPWHAGNYINEAEALAAMVWIETLAEKLRGVDVMLFVDNAAAEGILLSGYSRSKHLTILAALFWQAVRRSRAAAWVGRVPSALNVADGPSRDDLAGVQELGAVELRACLPQPGPWQFMLSGRLANRPLGRALVEENKAAAPPQRRVRRQRQHQGQLAPRHE